MDRYQRAGDWLSAGRLLLRQLALDLQAGSLPWLDGRHAEARRWLHQAQDDILTCPVSLQANGKAAIYAAMDLLNKPQARRWPAWDWQAYDELCLAILLPR